jgi:hypothetical protein
MLKIKKISHSYSHLTHEMRVFLYLCRFVGGITITLGQIEIRFTRGCSQRPMVQQRREPYDCRNALVS